VSKYIQKNLQVDDTYKHNVLQIPGYTTKRHKQSVTCTS